MLIGTIRSAFFLLLGSSTVVVLTAAEVKDVYFLNQFAVQLKSGGRDVAEAIAKQHGFVVHRELPNIGVFLLEHPHLHHRSKRSADSELNRLTQDERVKHAQQEIALNRLKRNILHDKQLEMPMNVVKDDSVYARYTPSKVSQRDNIYGWKMTFNDPKFNDMWYLINQGQSGGEKGMDLNLAVVWKNGFTGKGIVVCILDDGIDHTHPDLIANYDPKASTDLNDKLDYTDDPMPDTLNKDNSHGTRCAGEIAAAANNDVCGVGVAYEASVGGIRVLDGTVTDALEAEAIRFNNNYIDIYSASWGPNDDGATMEGPGHLALEALREGVLYGRNGLGSIYVWATGNGGMNQDDCSADGYVSRPETLSVGSVNELGRSPFFMENCTSTLVVVPSGGEEYQGQEETEGRVKLKVVTTDLDGGCIENFQGTSSAAPLAAGCLANVLQANPNLTWRDVQHIVVHGARIPSVDSSWQVNGAGHHVSHRFGFGLMDCGKMVQLAQSWSTVSEQVVCKKTRRIHQILKSNGEIHDSIMVTECGDDQSNLIDHLEHVQVHLSLSSKRRGDLKISLISPSGTRSELLSPRPRDEHEGSWEFTFMTVHHWDERPLGKWTMEIAHQPFGQHDVFESSNEHNGDDSTYPPTKTMEWSTEKNESIEQVKEDPGNIGYVENWSLIFYGTQSIRYDRAHTNYDGKNSQKAYYPSSDYMAHIKSQEYDLSQRLLLRKAESGRPEIKRAHNHNDKLIENLWNLLHRRKNQVVSNSKRTLTSSDSSHLPSDKISEMDQLINEILKILE